MILTRRRVLMVAATAFGCSKETVLREADEQAARSGSPITNPWGQAKATRVETEQFVIFRGVRDQAFNHQQQLTSHGGKLFASWSQGIMDEDAPGQRMMISWSGDEGRTWSTARVIAPSRPGKFAGSIVLSTGLRVHQGRLIAYYGEWERSAEGLNADGTRKRGGSIINCRTEARVSEDWGKTWSEGKLMIDNFANYFPPAPTRSGRLIFPVSSILTPTIRRASPAGGGPGFRVPEGHRDDYFNSGVTAKLVGINQRFNEGVFYQTDDGVIRMMLRNESGKRLGVSESRNDGVTWTKPVLTDYTDTICRAHFGRLPDGRFFGMTCPDPEGSGQTGRGRTPAVLTVSRDGITFDRHFGRRALQSAANDGPAQGRPLQLSFSSGNGRLRVHDLLGPQRGHLRQALSHFGIDA